MDVRPIIQPSRMQLGDLDAVLSIESTSFAQAWSRNMFLEEMANDTARVIVFKANGKLVGYLCFWKVVDEAHLLNIAVHPDFRGRGLGREIMAHLETLCRQEGLTTIILEVARRNGRARNLYRKCGFETTGFRKNYYPAIKDDALIMAKKLSAANSRETAAGGSGEAH
ncbi:MAG: ribosomal protein S18-alanine N-acetyltransferase [Desulfomonile tiedjei]|nr:ribosomal protein S18-alanine N-acetyltransferase [Desulfomonile tiedjei]